MSPIMHIVEILRPVNIVLSLLFAGISIGTVAVRAERVPLAIVVLVILLATVMMTWLIQAELYRHMVKKLTRALERSGKDELEYLELIPDSLIPDPRLD